MKVLPPSAGWVPWVWLVYLLNLPVVLWFMPDDTWVDWAWMAAALAAFLPLYFGAFWVRGRRLAAVVVATVVLAALAIPVSPGASVFFIYAAAMAAGVGRPRDAWLLILAVTLAVPAHAAFAFLVLGWGVPELPYVYLPALIFTPIIGSVNIFYAERSRQNAELRQAREEVETLAKIAERERIARDLHDLLGHTLSTITLKAELAARLAPRDAARAEAEMREVEAISRNALAEVRQAVRGYRSLGLPAEIERAKQALDAAGVELEWFAERVPLTPAQENVVALALREGVTNVVRHAGAVTCRVRLWREGGHVHLEVADDGAGRATYAGGSGLTGMRERVAELGGQVRIDGTAGTVLRVSLPATPDVVDGSARGDRAVRRPALGAEPT